MLSSIDFFKDKINKLYFAYFISLLTVATINMSQPIFPTIISKNNINAIAFGIFLSSTAISNLIFSPIWGEMSDKKSKKKIMSIGILGFGITQLFFLICEKVLLIVIIRLITGVFMSAYLVSSLANLVDYTNKENRSKLISYFSATSTLGTSIGSLIGGILGEFEYRYVFLLQFFLSIIIVCLIQLFIKDNKKESYDTTEKYYGNKNSSFSDIKHFDKNIKLALLSIALLSFAITNYNSNIAFFVESELNLSTYFIGIILSLPGFISIFMNFIINPYLLNKYSDDNIFLGTTILAGISILIAININNNVLSAIFIILYLCCSYLNMPLQQSSILKLNAKDNGKILGLQNSMRSIGMILGSLITGFVFGVNPRIPFILCGIIFLCTSFIIVFLYKKNKSCK